MVDLRRLGFEARELSAAALLAQVGSMAGLRTPLSTLHVRPHDRPRMTRGRCGSLLLHRNGLAPSALCRSPGAPDTGPSGNGALRRLQQGNANPTDQNCDDGSDWSSRSSCLASLIFACTNSGGNSCRAHPVLNWRAVRNGTCALNTSSGFTPCSSAKPITTCWIQTGLRA